tara:strand:+ start:201 stop:563 length:363 start_codon:yes stop_codon:yes gene_type:complete
MKEVYYNMETTLAGLRKAMMDCIERGDKSLTEWEEESEIIQKKLEEKHMREQSAKDYEQKRQENIKNYSQQVDKQSRYDSRGQFIDLAGELDRSNVHVDEYKQNRAELNFATAAGIELDE